MVEQSSITIERRGNWHPALTDPTNRLYGSAAARQMGPEHMDLLIDGRGFRLGLSDEQIIGYTLLMEAGFSPSADDDLLSEATEIGYAYGLVTPMSDQQDTTDTTIRVTAWGAADALGEPFEFSSLLDRDEAELTTDHARSSHGLPVVIRNGRVFGPADLPGVVLHWSTTASPEAGAMIAPARAAGWTVEVGASCDWCATDLTDAETRRPGEMHPLCAEAAARIRAQMAAPDYRPIPLSEYRAR